MQGKQLANRQEMKIVNKRQFNTLREGILLLVAGMVYLSGSIRLSAQDESVSVVPPVDPVVPEVQAVQDAPAVPVAPAAPVVNGKVKASSSRTRLLTECTDIPGLAKPFNYRTDGQDIVKYLNMLVDPDVGGDLNLIVSTRVAGTVRLALKGVTVGDAFEIALADNRLAYEIKGTGPRSTIRVMTDEEYRADHGVSFYEQRQVKMMDLRNTKPSRMMSTLDQIKSTIGKIIADDSSGTLVLIDTPSKIEEMVAMIDKSERDQPLLTVTRVFRLQYADLSDLSKVVAESLTKDIGKMTVNTKTKSVIVTDLANSVAKIAGMVEAFDRKPKQVVIEAQIVEVELNDQFKMGVNWKQLFKGLNPRFNLQSGAPLSAGVSPTLRYDTIINGFGELTLVVDALKTVGNTKVISKPLISVQDGEAAMIKVVKNQPWKKVQYEAGSTNIVGVDYQFIEIGTTLAVTPIINDQSLISMTIKPTISTLDGWYDAAPGTEGIVGIPVVKKSEASTSVMVKDGVTIIIGGMIKTEKRVTTLAVPVLGSIPILGRLFKSEDTQSVKTETIVFLTPRIITGEEPFLQMADGDNGLKLRANGGNGTNVQTTASDKEVKIRTE